MRLDLYSIIILCSYEGPITGWGGGVPYIYLVRYTAVQLFFNCIKTLSTSMFHCYLCQDKTWSHKPVKTAIWRWYCGFYELSSWHYVAATEIRHGGLFVALITPFHSAGSIVVTYSCFYPQTHCCYGTMFKRLRNRTTITSSSVNSRPLFKITKWVLSLASKYLVTTISFICFYQFC